MKSEIYVLLKRSFQKLKIKYQIKNPVMFLVYVCSIITSFIFFASFIWNIPENKMFLLIISLSLWFTVLFSNFAETIAESRRKSRSRIFEKNKKRYYS